MQKPKEIELKLQKIFTVNFGTEDVTNLNRRENPEWDSLKHAILLLEVQKEFGIKFKVSDLNQLNSFKEIFNLVLNYCSVRD